jgi:hypothetical protein
MKNASLCHRAVHGARRPQPADGTASLAALSPPGAQLQRRHLIAVLEQLAGFYAGQRRVVLGWEGLRDSALVAPFAYPCISQVPYFGSR